jgi:hypothetical protein
VMGLSDFFDIFRFQVTIWREAFTGVGRGGQTWPCHPIIF